MTTKPSYNHIPALRFPDFANDGEWEVKRLREIVKVVDEKCSIDRLDIETYISTENILQNFEGVKRAAKLPDTGSFTRFQKGDVLFSNIRPYLKKVWEAEFDGAASNDVIVFRALKKFDNQFVSQIIKSDVFIAYTMSGAKGVKMPRGDKKLMLDYTVLVPSFAEQQRIAACLSAADEMINAINGKLEQLKAYKKGLMQKLFPAKGKKLPELRFKEFEKDGEWGEKRLGEILIERREVSVITDKLPQLSFTIAEGVIRPEDKKTNQRDFLMTDKDNKVFLVTRLYDIIYNPANVIYGAIHKNNLCDGVVSPIYKIFYTQENADFLNYLLRRPSFISQLASRAEGTVTKLKTLKAEAFLEMSVPFTANTSEQQKIADCLTTIDEMTNQCTNKITMLELYKKGLMQRMFPQNQTN